MPWNAIDTEHPLILGVAGTSTSGSQVVRLDGLIELGEIGEDQRSTKEGTIWIGGRPLMGTGS